MVVLTSIPQANSSPIEPSHFHPQNVLFLYRLDYFGRVMAAAAAAKQNQLQTSH
jgi:hypothetical protein